MTFLNASLIFGVAAITVPIVLHFLARREPKKVVFPSVRFLTKKFETNRSRVQVRRWWLLALRIAALAILALALAQPAIARSLSLTWLTIALFVAIAIALLVMASVAMIKNQSRALGYTLGGGSLLLLMAAGVWAVVTASAGPALSIDRAQPVAIAIVLDNSPTSEWRTSEDDRIGRMQDLATWMVTRVPRGSQIAVVDRSSQVVTFSLDTSSAVARIEQSKPLEVVQPISSRLQAAARLLRTSELDQRRILLITDLSISTWDTSATEQALVNTFQAEPEIALTVFDLGEFNDFNRSLAIPRFVDSSPAGGIPVATTIQLSEFPTSSSLSVTAELAVYENDPALPVVRNGVVQLPSIRRVDRTSVKLSAGESREVVLTMPPLDVGTHHGLISLVGSDAMPLDDTRYFSIQVLPPSPVLLVSNDWDEARIIDAAITATDGVTENGGAAFVVEQIRFDNLAVVRLEDFDSLILLDPPEDVIRDEAIEQFARGGGGVLVALGPAAGNDSIESPWLPRIVRRWRIPQPGSFLEVVQARHPVLESLTSDTPWSDFRISQYWQVELLPSDSALVQYADTEHAAVIQRRFTTESSSSSGIVLALTTPIPALAEQTRRWNDLFGSGAWPAWLLTRNAIDYLTGRGSADRMTALGQPRSVRLPTNADESRPERLQVFRPGAPLPTPLEIPADADRATINEVSRSGTYWIRGLTSGDGFSANLSDRSLLLDRIEPDQLSLFFGADQYTLATDREQIKFAETGTANRLSLHSPAMLLALAVFLLEQILGNRFYRKPNLPPVAIGR